MTNGLKHFYQNNDRFHGYVDRCAASDMVTAEEILSRALTREVAKYYQEADAEEDGGIPAGKSTYAPMGECV